MRIRVPTRTAFTVALALAVLTTCSYYVYTLHRRLVTPTRPVAFHIDSADAQQWANPQVLLAAADHFYFLNNGPAAAPLYARAEILFSQRGDPRNELHAKVGRLRSEAETMSFVDLSRFLNEQLQNPMVQGDKRLRLPPLFLAGGMIETFGSLLLLIGLFTRPVAFILSGEMAVAYFKFHARQGFWPLLNDGEGAVLSCFIVLYPASTGGGPWTLDRLLRNVHQRSS